MRPGNRPGYSLTANREGRPRGATPSATGADLAPARNTRGMHARHGPARVVTFVVVYNPPSANVTDARHIDSKRFRNAFGEHRGALLRG